MNLIIFIQVLNREPAVNATDPSIAFDRIPNRHVARILHWEHRSWAPKARESRRQRRREECDWGGGVPLPNRLEGLGRVASSPSGVRQRIFGIFEVHRTLLVERTVPTKPFFSVKKSTQSTIGGHGPPGPLPLNTPLTRLKPKLEAIYIRMHKRIRFQDFGINWEV